MMTRLLTVPLLFVMAAGLLGAGLPQGFASAQDEPPTPPAMETFLSYLRYDGLLDVPRLPPEKAAAVQDAPQASLVQDYAAWSRLVFQSLRNQNDWEVYPSCIASALSSPPTPAWRSQ